MSISICKLKCQQNKFENIWDSSAADNVEDAEDTIPDAVRPLAILLLGFKIFDNDANVIINLRAKIQQARNTHTERERECGQAEHPV